MTALARRSVVCLARRDTGAIFAAALLLALLLSRGRVLAPLPPRPACAVSDLDCLLASRTDARGRVIITAASGGMLPFSENLLLSLVATGAAPHALVVALDAAAAARLQARGAATYWPGASPDGGALIAAAAAAGQASSAAAAAAAPLRFGSAAYRDVTMLKNAIVAEVLARGYHVVFTDADTVWLRNVLTDGDGLEPLWGDELPRAVGSAASGAGATAAASAPALGRAHAHLAHTCAGSRLGDTTAALGDGVPAELARRADCAPPAGWLLAGAAVPAPAALGAAAFYAYDVKGTYGDSGGLDTAFYYMRATARSLAHMRRVCALQATPEGRSLPSDQEAFNALLQPWLPAHLTTTGLIGGGASPALLLPWLQARESAPPLQPPPPPPPPLPYTAAELPLAIDTAAGLGPDRLRVALFDALPVPNGCRLAAAMAARADVLIVHANCVTGGWQKAFFLFQHGQWHMRLWDDSHVAASAAVLAMLYAAAVALQRGRVAASSPKTSVAAALQ